MELPSFDKFLTTVEGEKMDSIITDSVGDDMNGPFDLQSVEGASAFAATLVSFSSAIAVNLLREYHEWLQQQLD